MDKNGNLTSVNTYDSDFSVEEIEAQTKDHFAEMRKLMKEDNDTLISAYKLFEETGYELSRWQIFKINVLAKIECSWYRIKWKIFNSK